MSTQALAGTVARLDTLIMLSHGTRYDVPVLTDVQITPVRMPLGAPKR